MAWSYKREESDRVYAPLPEGNYRIRIRSAEKAMSKNGRDMLALQFDVSGNNQILYHYIVFLDDRPEITNRMLTQFFDAFPQIPEGDFNMANWIGKVGACNVKHEDYNGNATAKIHYFIAANRQKDLPSWQEPPSSVTPSRDAAKDDFMPIPEGDIPLF